MSSTHLSLHVHVVFGTKARQPFIAPDWQERLHAFLGGAVRHMDAVPEAVGGVADHVHLLIGLKATHRLADVVRELKRASSEWVHATVGLTEFAWQEGYGAFSVGARDREAVRAYLSPPKPSTTVRARSGRSTSPSCAAAGWNTTSVTWTEQTLGMVAPPTLPAPLAGVQPFACPCSGGVVTPG